MFLRRGVVSFPKRGGCIPPKGCFYPPQRVVLSPPRGGFIPLKSGHTPTRGGFMPHLGVVLCPGPHAGVFVGNHPQMGDKTTPNPFFLPPGGRFIPPFAEVCLSPKRGGFIPAFGHWGDIGVRIPEIQYSGAVYGAVAVNFLRRRRRKLPCDSQNRTASVRSGGTIEQLLPRPPHLHVLFQRSYRNVQRTSPREQDKRPASSRRGARVPG